jgi:hypothetical protein
VSKPLSLPVEHGGYLTAAAAGVAAALVAPAPAAALAVGVAVLAAFLARGVTDRVLLGKSPASWDWPWLALLILVGAATTATLSLRAATVTAAACVGLVLASVLARRARRHRTAIVEAAGMGLLGASAGWAAHVAGASLRDAACVAVVLATHAALSVPLVRTQLRRRERHDARRAAWLAGAGIALAVAAAFLLGRPLVALALAPRALHALLHSFVGARSPPPSAAAVGVRETVALALAVTLIAVTL